MAHELALEMEPVPVPRVCKVGASLCGFLGWLSPSPSRTRLAQDGPRSVVSFLPEDLMVREAPGHLDLFVSDGGQGELTDRGDPGSEQPAEAMICSELLDSFRGSAYNA